MVEVSVDIQEQEIAVEISAQQIAVEYSGMGALQHNTLSGKQGGAEPDEFYHLSAAELANLGILTGGGDTTLHSHSIYVEVAGDSMTGTLDMTDNPIVDVGWVDFNLVNGVPHQEGRASWNDDEGVLNIGLKGGEVNLQVGLEQLLRGKNVTGTGSTNGLPGRISGAVGANPTLALADLSSIATAEAIGLFTEDIVSNANGYLTTSGLVRDINTTGSLYGETWIDGERIFVGNSPGTLTKIVPSGDSRKIFVGIVTRSHATEGIIWANPLNIYFLQELSGMSISGLSDGDALTYELSTNTWTNTALGTMAYENAGDYLPITGGALTGALSIVGSSDVVQSVVQANAVQNENLSEYLADDGTTVLSGVDERGILFSDGGTVNTNLMLGDGAGNNTMTGATNLLLGSAAGSKLTTGGGNMFLGSQAGAETTTGGANVFIGAQAGISNLSGKENVFIGREAGKEGETALRNVAIGYRSGKFLSGANVQGNVFVGWHAGEFHESGNNNIFIGNQTGLNNLTGDSNVFIGKLTGQNELGSNKLYIANSNTVTPLIYGLFTGAGAGLTIYGQNVAGVPLNVRAIAGQSSPVQTWENSSGEKGAEISPDTKEIRWWDVGASDYVGFKAPALTASQIWALPIADGAAGEQLTTDGAGNLYWS